MHVLIVHQAFAHAGEPGGTRHFEFARYLVKHGHRVTVLAGQVNHLTGSVSPAMTPDAVDGIRIIRPYTYRRIHKSFVHRVISFVSFMLTSAWAGLWVKNVDVVVGTSPPILQGVTAWLIARTKRVPFVFEVRDLWPAFAIELGVVKSRLVIRVAQSLERFLYRSADRLIVNSPGFVAHVQRVSARTPSLIPNGVDTSMFQPSRRGDAFRARWLADGCFVALYAGAHGLANDLHVLLDAAALLSDEPLIKLVFVGDGKERTALEAAARTRGLRNVIFDGAHPKEVMPEVIAAADVCVAILRDIPLFRTTYPNKVFDYMAAGKPTLVAIDGVIREVIEAAGGGVFVPPGDASQLAAALRTLASDPEACLRMGRNARDYVSTKFNRDDQAAAFSVLLRQCVDETTV
jgi:glycosyltransferase involved in cell wall biosynthesis